MFNDDSGELSVVAARLVEAACFVRDGNREAAKAHIASAIALLGGEPSTNPANLGPPHGDARENLRSGLTAWQKRRLTTYIDAHLTGTIHIEELAKQVTLSKGHFSRAFRSSFGTCADEYLTRRRIELAQSLMLTSAEALCAIALRCGFCDQPHFNRVFRRIVGETPRVWRRTRWGDIEDRATELSSSPTDSRGVSVHPTGAGSDRLTGLARASRLR